MRTNNNVNEGSSLRLQVEVVDIEGKPTVSASAKFKICDWENGAEVQPWKQLTPGLIMMIEIPASLNIFKINSDYFSSTRSVTVEAIDNQGFVKTEEIHYRINDLKGL